MAECPFCFTQLDDRAIVCSGCGARKGLGYTSNAGVYNRLDVEKDIKKARNIKAAIAILTVLSAITVYAYRDEHDGIGGSIAILILGSLIYIVVSVVSFSLKRKLKKPMRWWK